MLGPRISTRFRHEDIRTYLRAALTPFAFPFITLIIFKAVESTHDIDFAVHLKPYGRSRTDDAGIVYALRDLK